MTHLTALMLVAVIAGVLLVIEGNEAPTTNSVMGFLSKCSIVPLLDD